MRSRPAQRAAGRSVAGLQMRDPQISLPAAHGALGRQHEAVTGVHPSVRLRAINGAVIVVFVIAIVATILAVVSSARPLNRRLGRPAYDVVLADYRATGPPPLSPLAVAAPFRAPDSVYAAGHRGVDLVGSPGQLVMATLPGGVAFAGQVAGVGVVSVDIGNGRRVTY